MGRVNVIQERLQQLSFEPLIDSAAAAELLKIHRKTLERMAIRREIPAHKVGRYWRFRASELDEWLSTRVASRAAQIPSRRMKCRHGISTEH